MVVGRVGQGADRAPKSRRRIETWRRTRCTLVQPNATPCKLAALSRRHPLVFRRFPKPRVAGSNPVSRSKIKYLRDCLRMLYPSGVTLVAAFTRPAQETIPDAVSGAGFVDAPRHDSEGLVGRTRRTARRPPRGLSRPGGHRTDMVRTPAGRTGSKAHEITEVRCGDRDLGGSLLRGPVGEVEKSAHHGG